MLLFWRLGKHTTEAITNLKTFFPTGSDGRLLKLGAVKIVLTRGPRDPRLLLPGRDFKHVCVCVCARTCAYVCTLCDSVRQALQG